MFVSLSACALLHIVMSPLCFIIAHFNTQKKSERNMKYRLNYTGCDSLSKWNALHQFWNITDCPFSLFFIERKVLNLKCFNNEEDVTPFLTSCGVLLAHPSQKVHFVKNLVSTNRCLLKIYFSTFYTSSKYAVIKVL